MQINLIAQNFVENPAYFSPEFQATEEFKHELTKVPLAGWQQLARMRCSRCFWRQTKVTSSWANPFRLVEAGHSSLLITV